MRWPHVRIPYSKIKRYIAGALVYYLYSYFLLAEFAQLAQQANFTGQKPVNISPDIGPFDFCGHYFLEFLSLVISSYLGALLMGWVISSNSKWRPIVITMFTTIPTLIAGILIVYKLWGRYDQETGLFYSGLVYITFSILNPFIVVLGSRSEYNFVSEIFRFKKIHLLWIWMPLSTYIPRLLFLLLLNLLKDIVDFFDIIPSFNIKEMLQGFISIALLSLAIKLIKYPVKYSLEVMNKELFVNIKGFYRLLLTWGILIVGFYVIWGFAYGAEFFVNYFKVFN